MAGWLGDAVLAENGTTVLKNDDYCADLDAENTYRYLLNGYSSVDAISEHYCSFSNTRNRATMFLSYIPYDVVREKVYYVLMEAEITFLRNAASEQGDIWSVNYYNNLLNDEGYHWDTIQTSYPDTYNFLISLENGLANIGEY